MKVFVAIVLCKILYFIGKKLGRGSSLPGQAALKMHPGVLKKLKLPGTIIAVTGSNGKTSTAELIAHALTSCGKKVGWNHEGANQTEGVATLLLRIASLGGTVDRDALVLECDERYALSIFKEVRPTILVVTNLCRDQLTRNGHHEFIQDCIRVAIEACDGKTKLILNADDPFVASLAADAAAAIKKPSPSSLDNSEFRIPNSEFVVTWFGLDSAAATKERNPSSPDNSEFRIPNSEFSIACGVYDDGAFCPLCKSRMAYEYRIAGHYGSYSCSACSFSRQKPEIEVKKPNLQTGEITIIPNSEFRIPNSIHGVYNMAAALTAAGAAGVSIEDARHALDGYELTGGRTVRFCVSGREGTLLISKHENSFSYNQSLSLAAGNGEPCTVIVMVDSISRKYYTSETSWLWDIDFDILSSEDVRHVVLVGRYMNELMARFAMSVVDPQKISCIADPSALPGHIEKNTTGRIYAITCFADKAKLMKEFGIRN